MSVNIHNALACSDYQCDERTREVRWLAEQAKQHNRIVEVGSYKGCTARAMAENTLGTVYCVDTFKGSVGEVEMARELASHEEGWLKNLFLKNMQGLGNFVVWEMPSLNAAKMAYEVFGPVFDMIFLDASHDYDSVKTDIVAWLPLLSPGGLLCGHDRTWDGVSRAVNELLGEVKVGEGAIWYR